MASASIDAEYKAELSKKLTAFTAAQLIDYIEHTGHEVPEDRKTDKIILKKMANELVSSGKYNISPFKLTTPAETSTPKQHEVAVKLFQQTAQNFDFEQYMKFTKIENERLENIRKVEPDDREKTRLAEIKLAEKIRSDEKLLAEKFTKLKMKDLKI